MSSSDPVGRHHDICVLVRDLFADIGLPTDPYPVQIKQHVIPALEKKLKPEFEGQAFKIHLEAKDWDRKNIVAMLVRYKTHAKVWYHRSSLNLCYRRFAVCKELAHLLIDNAQEHFTSDPIALIQQLITNVPMDDAATDLGSEQFAALSAVEILIPWGHRKMLRGMLEDGATDREVAEKIRVPEKIVNFFFRSKFGEESDKIYEGLEGKDR